MAAAIGADYDSYNNIHLRPVRLDHVVSQESLPSLFAPFVVQDGVGELAIWSDATLAKNVLEAMAPTWPNRVRVQRVSHEPWIYPDASGVIDIAALKTRGPTCRVTSGWPHLFGSMSVVDWLSGFSQDVSVFGSTGARAASRPLPPLRISPISRRAPGRCGDEVLIDSGGIHGLLAVEDDWVEGGDPPLEGGDEPPGGGDEPPGGGGDGFNFLDNFLKEAGANSPTLLALELGGKGVVQELNVNQASYPAIPRLTD